MMRLMKLDEARAIAEEVVARLAPLCERVEVAGSIRRTEVEVGDIEIVYQSRMGFVDGQLLDVHQYPLSDDAIADMVDDGLLAYDEEVRRNGPLYKRMVHRATGIAVELFRATAENWGLILALRTGPAAFNKMLVAHGWEGGVLPPDYKVRDGRLWYRGVAQRTAEESDLFDALGMPTWPPWQRHPGRLKLWHEAQRRVQVYD